MTPPEQPTPPSLPEPASVPWFLEEGDRVRDYTVRRPIGDGSASIVYEVEDEAGVHFALKLSRAPLSATGKHPIQCERFFQGAIVHFALRDADAGEEELLLAAETAGTWWPATTN